MTEKPSPIFYADDEAARLMLEEGRSVVTLADYEALMERRVNMTAIPVSSALFKVMAGD